MAVEPQADAARRRDGHGFLEITQAVRDAFAPAVRQADRIMRDQDARTGGQLLQKAAEAVELLAPGAAGSVPEPAVGFRRIDADQPRFADALGEGIHVVVEPIASLPWSEATFEGAGGGGRLRAVIVVAWHRHAWQALDVQQLGSAAVLGLESQGGGVAGEDDAVVM